MEKDFYGVYFMEKEPCTKFFGVLIRFNKVIQLLGFEFSVSDVLPANVQNMSRPAFFAFFVSFMEKKPPIKFDGVFDHFSRTYEITRF